MVKRFSDDRSPANVASQIWHILVSRATEGKTVTYGEITDLIGYGSPQAIGPLYLDLIARWCKENGQPPLTVVVVNKDTRQSGSGFPVAGDQNELRDEVFKKDWFNIVPPQPEELG